MHLGIPSHQNTLEITMNVAQLREALKYIPDHLEVFYRKTPPIFSNIGNIEPIGTINLDTYGAFGKTFPCVIIEPIQED
jgi:hypothetical protein